MPSFELGINRTDLVEKRTVAGLKPGSEAEKAGLREGDTVIGTSVYWNDTSKPVKLSIRRGKTTSKIEYYPRGPSLGLVPQYAIDKGLLEGDPQRCRVSGAIH
jgi:predicted metalloprotease with PDZ domain